MKLNSPIQPSRPDGGLTLLEIVVVVAILTILAGVAVPTMSSWLDSRSEDLTADRIQQLEDGLFAYARDHEGLPASLSSLESSSDPRWRGPYLPRYVEGWVGNESHALKDDWGRAFEWQRQSRAEGSLRSAGTDGLAGTEDDLLLVVDVRPVLRDITLERLRVVNAAVRAYNAAFVGVKTLPPDAHLAVQELKSEGYLSSGPDWKRDAFGDLLQPDGSPVGALLSVNVHIGPAVPGGAPEDG